MQPDFTYYEFFAGGGGAAGAWARVALSIRQRHQREKGESYRANFNGADELLIADINDMRVADLPERATLAWASFPCQDLSLAGAGRGIDGERSGAFWPFWRLLLQLQRDGAAFQSS